MHAYDGKVISVPLLPSVLPSLSDHLSLSPETPLWPSVWLSFPVMCVYNVNKNKKC